MYFTKIRLNGLFATDLPIVGALPSDRYILKSADGLGPPEVDVLIADTLNAGGIYQGRRSQSREIVLHIGLNPDYNVNQTVSDLRSELYGLLSPGNIDEVRVEIMNDTVVVAQTTGHVKKLEIIPFSKEPEVQVTIACLQQYLQAPHPVFVDSGSLSEYFPEILNVGTAPTGFYMEVNFTGHLDSWNLIDSAGRKMFFEGEHFSPGNTLIIDTRPGSRGIWLDFGSGYPANIVYTLSSDSVWHMLHSGLNTFSVEYPLFNWGDVYYLPQFWGI